MKNVLRNYWFLAGLGEEVKDKPLPRRILDIPLVFFRGQDGNVAALLDRCPHRFAPLSRGRVDGVLSRVAVCENIMRTAPSFPAGDRTWCFSHSPRKPGETPT